MRLKVEVQSPGPVPSEKVVTIETQSGREDVVVHVSQLKDNRVDVGLIHARQDMSLVELPRESLSGRWRVWVAKESLSAE